MGTSQPAYVVGVQSPAVVASVSFTVVAILETPRSPFKLLCHETSATIGMVIRRHAMLQACVVHSVSAASMART